jgi:hypothetical protein
VGSELLQKDSITTPVAPSRAATWSVLTRVVQATASLAVVALVGLRLDASTQGYFYSCAALIAFLPLAEFGVSYAVMQSASHHTTGLRWTTAGLTGTPEAVQRVAGLLRVARRWNVTATLAATTLLGWLGWKTLQAGGTVPAHLPWQWAALLTLAAAWQLLSPRIAVLEGAGRVEDVWHFRLVQEILAGAALIGALAVGLSLFSLGAAYALRVAHGAAWLSRPDRALPQMAGSMADAAVSHWRVDVWPFQWRVGVSIICGFLIYYLFAPVLLAVQGPVIAGRFGMSLALAAGVQNATSAWVNSQAPHYGELVAAGRYHLLDIEFAKTFRRSTLLALSGAASILVGAIGLSVIAPGLAARLLPPFPLGLLMAAALVNHAVFALSVYLRAHRRDPLLVPSLIGAIAMSVGIVWAARSGSPTVVAGMYFVFTLVGLAMAVAIFASCRRRWHRVHT